MDSQNQIPYGLQTPQTISNPVFLFRDKEEQVWVRVEGCVDNPKTIKSLIDGLKKVVSTNHVKGTLKPITHSVVMDTIDNMENAFCDSFDWWNDDCD